MVLTSQDPCDDEVMRRVAAGSADALGVLHRRFARLIFAIAVRSLDRAAAEDLVQDVFLAVWRNAERFDPERGSVRAWILQIAHFRLLNELRRRSRQPEIVADDGVALGGVVDDYPGPAEATWQAHRRALVAAALEELPAAQREAVGLAFLDDLTHEQVAAELGVPLGTAKTRIRAGLQKLRGSLAPYGAALVALTLLIALGIRYGSERATVVRYDRTVSMLTASDSVNLRLAPVAGTPEATHARYRGRPGVALAVVTLSNFAAAPANGTYQVWVRHGATWTSLGTVAPDATGSARVISEDTALGVLPDAVEVTLEPRAGSPTPGERVVVAWAR
jgi:RNA polymerase sigma-70 factor (ECF subfamily)